MSIKGFVGAFVGVALIVAIIFRVQAVKNVVVGNGTPAA